MDPLGQALGLACLGLAVFPCRTDKRPACPHGFKDASCEVPVVASLWARWPGELVGVACGPPSGLAVLDLDTARHPEALVWLHAASDRLDGAWRVMTRSGGQHLWFRWVEGVRCAASRPILGVDVRGEGGYVIWWGGDALRGIAGLSPFPTWLSHQLWPPVGPRPSPPSGRRRDDLAPLLAFVEDSPEGERNSRLYWAACRAREAVEEGRLAETEAIHWLAAAAQTSGLRDHEIGRTLRSAFEGRSG